MKKVFWKHWHRDEFKSGGTRPAWSARKNYLSCPFTLLALLVQLVVLVSAFVMVSTVWSVFCLLFVYSRCPRVQPFVKVGARIPVPYGVSVGVYKYLKSKPMSTIIIKSY